MSEKKEKKTPTPKSEDKKDKGVPERDQNGRFAKTEPKKPQTDDSTVKIHVVKDDEGSKATEQGKKNPSEGFRCVFSIPWVKSIPVFRDRWIDRILDRVFQRFDQSFANMKREFAHVANQLDNIRGDTLKSFVAEVDSKRPQSITINGRTYYSEEDVSEKIQRTISTCAEVSAKEMEKAEEEWRLKESQQATDNMGAESNLGETDKGLEQYLRRRNRDRKEALTKKLSNVVARVIMWTFGGMIVASCFVGAVTIVKSFLK